MGRKPKCTVEEKFSAVEDYLNGIRSVSEIMVDLSIKSTRTIRNWILAYQNVGIEALCSVTANHSYSSEFKIEMVRKYYQRGRIGYRFMRQIWNSCTCNTTKMDFVV